MKKFILMLLIFTALSNCEIKPREAKAEGRWQMQDMLIRYEEMHGMKYAIISPGDQQWKTGVAIINLTKDELEVELIKLQIAKMK